MTSIEWTDAVWNATTGDGTELDPRPPSTVEATP